MGGVWEGQISTVRAELAIMLDSVGTQLDDESFKTFTHEAASTVNSCPLTAQNLHETMSAEP